MFLLMRLMRLPLPSKREIILCLLLGAVLYVGQSLTYFSALNYASAGVVALLLYTYPALVMLGSAVLFRERITAQKLVALFLALAGAFVIIGAEFQASPTGILYPDQRKDCKSRNGNPDLRFYHAGSYGRIRCDESAFRLSTSGYMARRCFRRLAGHGFHSAGNVGFFYRHGEDWPLYSGAGFHTGTGGDSACLRPPPLREAYRTCYPRGMHGSGCSDCRFASCKVAGDLTMLRMPEDRLSN